MIVYDRLNNLYLYSKILITNLFTNIYFEIIFISVL